MNKKQKYNKEPLSYSQQADLLLKRGLIADKNELISVLKKINYYRLSGYLYYFRDGDKDFFQKGTTLEKILKTYNFDKNLRILIIKPLEEIENLLKAKITYVLAHKYKKFGYLNENSFNIKYKKEQLQILEKKYKNKNLNKKIKKMKFEIERHNKIIASLKDYFVRSEEKFIEHYKKKYCEKDLPIWIAIELFTFGMTISLYRCLREKEIIAFSSQINISQKVFVSWLVSLNVLRNISVHHGRLWKRTKGSPPKIPRGNKYKKWKSIRNTGYEEIFYRHVSIIHYLCVKYKLNKDWEYEMKSLFNNNSYINYSDYGFPENWEDSEIWKMR